MKHFEPSLYTAYNSNTNQTPNNNPRYNIALNYSDIKPSMFGAGNVYPARCIVLKSGFYK